MIAKLSIISERTHCGNPGNALLMTADGFVKDCTTLGMVLAAREPGERRPGGIIVDGTAANSAHSPRLSAWRISG